jgi:hypothetical protein
MDVEVMTANRWPAREIRNARIGSFEGNWFEEVVSKPGKESAVSSSSRSTDWTAGV